jgi:hypothetical protein
VQPQNMFASFNASGVCRFKKISPTCALMCHSDS